MLMLATSQASAALTPILAEKFDTDPIAGGRASVASTDVAAASRFIHGGGALTAAYDTSRDTAYLVFNLPRTLTQADSFRFVTTATILNDAFYAPDDQGGFAQIGWGLLNGATTGFDRTGDLFDPAADTFDLISLDYFPTDSAFFDSITATPTVFESQMVASTDAFDGIHFPFGAESVITNTGEVAETTRQLPLDTPLTFDMTYDAPSRQLTLTISDPLGPLNINAVGDGLSPGGPDGDVTTVQETLPASAAFAVDQFGLLLWHDGYDQVFSPNVSLTANVAFDAFTVYAEGEGPGPGGGGGGTVPEPALLGVLGLFALTLGLRRRASSAQ
jgi:hypothetical protein